MDKKSKILVVAFIISILVSIFFTYKRSFIDHNFLIIEEETEAYTEEENQ